MISFSKFTGLSIILVCCLVGQNALAGMAYGKGTCHVYEHGKLIAKSDVCKGETAQYGPGVSITRIIPSYGSIFIENSETTYTISKKQNGSGLLNATESYRDAKTLKPITSKKAQSLLSNEQTKNKVAECTKAKNNAIELCTSNWVTPNQ